MQSAEAGVKRDRWERLRDPFRMRVALTLLSILAGYSVIYWPLTSHLEQARRRLQQERTRKELHADLDRLRAQVALFDARLPKQTDTNEWVQFVIQGIRRFPLKLNNLDSSEPRRIGPYEAVAMQVEVEGNMQSLDRLLHWFEANDRLIRLESVKLEAARKESTNRVLHATLLGLKG